MKRSLLLLATLLLSTSCVAESKVPKPQTALASEPSDPLTLVAYKAPSDVADRLHPILSTVLGKQGRATQTPDGRLLVAAPASMHKSLDVFFADEKLLQPQPRKTIRAEYWVVSGTTGTKTAPIQGLETALSSLEKAQGYTSFQVLDHMVLSSLDGEYASSSNQVLTIKSQRLSAREGQIEAHVDLHIQPHERAKTTRLETMLRLQPGQWAILGQAGYKPPAKEDTLHPAPSAPHALFYIVRATPVDR